MDRIKTTIVIPTFNRPAFCKRALLSAQSQDVPVEIIVMNDGSEAGYDEIKAINSTDKNPFKYIHSNRPDNGYLTWADGTYRASGDYVMLLADDDWIEPPVIRTLEFILECVGDPIFALSQTYVDYVDDDGNIIETKLNVLKNPEDKVGVFLKNDVEKDMLNMLYTISPHCCLFRKQMLLDSIIVNKIPSIEYKNPMCGHDTLILLLQILLGKSNYVGYCAKPLVHFTAHAGSTTINAMANEELHEGLKHNYRECKKFYLKLKEYNETLIKNVGV